MTRYVPRRLNEESLKAVVEALIEKGSYRIAFEQMWSDPANGMMYVRGKKLKQCPTCGNDEYHNDYWQFFDTDNVLITDPLVFADGERRRNPMIADCWRLDLTDEHQLQKASA